MFEAKFQIVRRYRPSRGASAPRVAALRAELARRGLDGFVVPRADRHQNEYVPACEERLAWLTGFTGSAGTAIVLHDRAALFVDGRYTVQAREQVDTALFAIEHSVETPPEPMARDERCSAGAGSATIRGCTPSTAPRGSRKACAAAGADAGPGRRQSDRRALDRPAGAAARRR